MTGYLELACELGFGGTDAATLTLALEITDHRPVEGKACDYVDL